MIVEQVIIDRDNNVDITLAIPIDDDSPQTLILLTLSPLSLSACQLVHKNLYLEVCSGPVIKPCCPRREVREGSASMIFRPRVLGLTARADPSWLTVLVLFSVSCVALAVTRSVRSFG